MVRAKKIIYNKRFVGLPKLTDFIIEEEDLPALKDGEVLGQAVYHSVDPYNMLFMASSPLGSIMIGDQIAKVIESKDKDFPVGSQIHGHFGWRTHTVFNPSKDKEMHPTYLLPDFGKHPASLGLGTLGMPGNAAYFGFLKTCRPKAGDVVVVTGAGGAVGSIVGQIAKLKGCTVIGFAGADSKCRWLTEDLGFDHAINYKTPDVEEQLRSVAPNGVDCFFDNVGGELSSQIIHQMRDFGRIAICGSISSYALDNLPKLPDLQMLFLMKQLVMEGFRIMRYHDQWLEGINELYKWVDEGKIKYQETITNGFENMPQALIDVMQGKNTGKAIVKP